MTEERIALARRAVACKGWRWMPGMLVVPNEHTVSVPLRLTDDHDWPHDLGLRLPDFHDPATLGCLLAMVRAAHGAPSVTFEGRTYPSVLHVVCFGGMYYVRRDCGDGDEDLYDDGLWSQDYRRDAYSMERTSEAEALVAALEAAP